MPPLVDRVQAFAETCALWRPETRVVAAVSGGSDSVALLFILRDLADAGALVLAGLAHLHHHIRREDADADAAFCEALAQRLGIPADIAHEDVPARAERDRQSLEVAARHARLDAFERARGRLGADIVALGHTRRDQAETVLLRLVRGAGPRGLGAMAPRNGTRVRPLLDVPRDDLRAFLRARGETWREDATNEDRTIARNHVRHAVMPALTRLNPRAEAALVRSARIHAADAAALDGMAAAAAAAIVSFPGQAAHVDVEGLLALPEAVSRRVLLNVLETLGPSRSYGWEETETVLQACRDGRARDLPGLHMERIGRHAVLRIRGSGSPAPFPGVQSTPLPVPGTAHDPAGRWVIEASGPLAPVDVSSSADDRVVLDAAALGPSLTVRTRCRGDRLQPLGLGGARKKLQDLFVDRKVPRDERDLVPLVLDRKGRIAWVAGHVVAEPFRVSPLSASVVVLTLRRQFAWRQR